MTSVVVIWQASLYGLIISMLLMSVALVSNLMMLPQV
jgi:hypothetical protein